MSEAVAATDGTLLPLASLETTLTYSGNLVTSMSVQYPNNLGVLKTYTQTFTYSGSNVTSISQWIPS